MGNPNKENYQQTLNEFSKTFEELIVPMEYLARKCNNFQYYFLFNYEKYQKIYAKMQISELIKIIDEKIKLFEKQLKSILNSNYYSKNILFTDLDIKGYLRNIILWKQCCSQYKYYFEKMEELFNDVKKSNSNREKINCQNNHIVECIEECKNNYEEKEKKQKKEEKQNTYQYQQQILLDKQKLIQAQELALLNDNFGRALASLECYANRISEKNLSNVFGYYDMFNLGKKQDLNELKTKAFIQTQIFKLAYEDYVKNYKQYNVPENINISDIKKLLILWIQNVPNEHQIMYKGMFNTISSLNNEVFENNFKIMSEQCKNATLDPRKIASFAPGVYNYNQQRCEEAKNEYIDEGKITSKLNINQSYKNDKKAELLKEQINLNNKLFSEKNELEDLK